MKFTIVLLALLGISFAEAKVKDEKNDGTKMDYFLYEEEDGSVKIENVRSKKSEGANKKRCATDIKYYFSRTVEPKVSLKLSSRDVRANINFGFTSDYTTYFVIHDWKNDKDSPMCAQSRKALLDNSLGYKINLFIVDWSSIANESYVEAQSSVTEVAELIGGFIQSLVESRELSLSNTVLVGHGLGAHISGNIGSYFNGEIDEIVALDPSLPLFSINNTENRVDKSDATAVQIIHTSSLGFQEAIGHYDFYPNGGETQPGCGVDDSRSCAHRRSYEYYVESVEDGGFTGYKCGSWSEFQNGSCSNNAGPEMGGINPVIRATYLGTWYLATNSESPFSMDRY